LIAPRRTLPRTHRLLRPEQFAAVMKGGRRRRDELFILYYLGNKLGHARLGLTVSRRTAPRSVDRNRLRRQVRESFRHHQTAIADLDIVIMAQPRATASDNARLRAALSEHWKHIHRDATNTG
jgi:ribonuclease P protein component